VRVAELVRQSTEQRAALVAAAEPIVRKVAHADRVAGYVWRYPVITSVLIGTIALAGPRKILDLGTRALTLYALFKG
jgi:hypothetical protein